MSDAAQDPVSLRHALRMRVVRGRVYVGLLDAGLTGDDARARLASFTDDCLLAVAQDLAGTLQPASFGDGSFLDWLQQHGPQVVQLVRAVVQMILMFK